MRGSGRRGGTFLLVPAQIAAWVIVCVLFLVLFVPPVWVMAASGVFAEFGNGDPSLFSSGG